MTQDLTPEDLAKAKEPPKPIKVENETGSVVTVDDETKRKMFEKAAGEWEKM